jgi:hypothetical protein
MLGEHPITPCLLATDLAAAREFDHGKPGLQIISLVTLRGLVAFARRVLSLLVREPLAANLLGQRGRKCHRVPGAAAAPAWT